MSTLKAKKAAKTRLDETLEFQSFKR